MIATELRYYRPESLGELPEALALAGAEGVCLYGGGSEIISMARAGRIEPGAVVDIKAIPECRFMGARGGRLVFGAALTLREIAGSGLFPLMGTTVSRIADHTNQCRITLGGNACGTIAYREAVLPLLLADASVRVWSRGSVREAPLSEAFCERMLRAPDELIVDFSLPERFAAMPFAHAKRTRGGKIDYPLATVAALRAPEGIRLALSGVRAYPFRDVEIEALARADAPPGARAERIVNLLSGSAISDALAGADYRLHALREALRETIERLEENA